MLNLIKKNYVKSVSKKSNKVLDVFTKTVSELEKINTEIEKAQEFKSKQKQMLLNQIENINIDHAELENHKVKHNVVINKINKIFES